MIDGSLVRQYLFKVNIPLKLFVSNWRPEERRFFKNGSVFVNENGVFEWTKDSIVNFYKQRLELRDLSDEAHTGYISFQDLNHTTVIF